MFIWMYVQWNTDSSATTPVSYGSNSVTVPALNVDCAGIKSLIDASDSVSNDDPDSDSSDDGGNNNDYTCNDGCEISPTWWEDGIWCDCPNCEDESQCSCASGYCDLTYCGDYEAGSCSQGRDTNSNNNNNNNGGSSRDSSSNNNDSLTPKEEILIYVASAVGAVLLLLIGAVWMIRRNKLKQQMVQYQTMENEKPQYQPPTTAVQA